MRRTVSRPAGFLRSIAAQGRLRCSASFSGGKSFAPPPGRSTRTTSAPSSASSMQAYGPGPSPDSSTTRIPASGPDGGSTGRTLATRSGVLRPGVIESAPDDHGEVDAGERQESSGDVRGGARRAAVRRLRQGGARAGRTGSRDGSRRRGGAVDRAAVVVLVVRAAA